MKKSSIRWIAWALLLGTTAISAIAGVKLGEVGALADILIRSRDPGPMANWSLFLIAISITCCLYVLRGIESGRWGISPSGTLLPLGAALALLLFGIDGLIGVVILSAVIAPFLLRTQSGDST